MTEQNKDYPKFDDFIKLVINPKHDQPIEKIKDDYPTFDEFVKLVEKRQSKNK